MLQIRKDLSFLPEAAQQEISVHATFQQLDGDLFLILIIITKAQIYRAHSAASDQAGKPVRSDASASHIGIIVAIEFQILRRVSRDVNQGFVAKIGSEQ